MISIITKDIKPIIENISKFTVYHHHLAFDKLSISREALNRDLVIVMGYSTDLTRTYILPSSEEDKAKLMELFDDIMGTAAKDSANKIQEDFNDVMKKLSS